MAKILFLVRSVPPFNTNRRDLDFIIENLIEKEGHQVDIYDPKTNQLINVNKNERFDLSITPKWIKIRALKLLFSFLGLIKFCSKNKGRYDITQINYLREEYFLIPSLINGLSDNLFIFIFGSDVNNKSLVKRLFTKIYSVTDVLIVTNKAIIRAFSQDLINKFNLEDKFKVIILPQEHFKLYEPCSYEKKNRYKEELDISPDKNVVIVGSNGRVNEQHEKIIEQLIKLNHLDDYFFIFPLSNRVDLVQERFRNLKTLIESSFKKSNFLLIKDYVSFEKITSLRFAADVLINLREKDQYTASIFEGNLAYNQIITGLWLPYDEYFEEMEVEVVQEMSELPTVLEKVFTDNQLTKKLQHNRNVVMEKYYYKVALDNWFHIYRTYLNSKEHNVSN